MAAPLTREATCEPATPVLTPITEAPNVITSAIDVASPAECVQLLNQCDGQIFTGWRTYNTVYSPSVVKTIVGVAMATARLLQNPCECSVVLSGCGTSGRLAYMIARSFNTRLEAEGVSQKKCYSYIIAGGDRALLKSVESHEDSYRAGVDSLVKAASGKKKVLFVGITCGLSAPFVAGQLDYCLKHLDTFTPVLVGFNPTSLARRNSIKDWDKTFYSVAKEMEKAVEAKAAYILNPVVGPEAITGSTRMKSGTATKMLLEVVFTCAHHAGKEMMTRGNGEWETSQVIHRCLQSYELVYRQTYLHSNAMATLLEIGAQSLYPSNGGHIYYLGDASSVSIMSVIDASECPPTYGAAYTDVRAFVKGGYHTLLNEDGDLQHLGPEYCIDWGTFIEECLPCINHNDLVVFVGGGRGGASDRVSGAEDLCHQVKEKGGRTALLWVNTPTGQDEFETVTDFDVKVQINLPWDAIGALWPFNHCHDDHMSAMFAEVAVKWVLNALTTGAHVMKGKVLGNKMVDLQVSNTKLYHRAVGIIQSFCGARCDQKEAEGFLQRAIYSAGGLEDAVLNGDIAQHVKQATGKQQSFCGARCDQKEAGGFLQRAIYSAGGLEDAVQNGDIAQHVKMATGKQQVVPLALLIASGLFTGEEAQRALSKDPVINRVLSATVTHCNS